jgi:hypothetical protein
MAQQTPKLRAALIGDVIGSRQSGDRARLQVDLRDTLRAVNDTVETAQELTVTIGDEFQGAYTSVPLALEAALRLQLEMMPFARLRIGIGWGELAFGDDRGPLDQDGPCWWRARDSMNRLKGAGPSSAHRTAISTGTDADALLGSYLSLRDHLIADLDPTDATVGLRLLAGATQTDLARELGLNKSSVSRRVRGHGIDVLIDSLPDVVVLPGSRS